MTWAERLIRLASGASGRSREVVDQLGAMHQRSGALERRLADAAAQAPTEGAETELRELSSLLAARTAALASALSDRGAPAAGAGMDAALNGAARNHWARLVAALETSREARAHLALHQPRLVEIDAGLQAVLDALDRDYYAVGLALRALIARADPQAVN